MDNRTMWSVGGNRVERQSSVQVLLCPQSRQLSVYAEFCLLACFYGWLQPTQELHHRYAVSNHRPAETFNFSMVLNRFHGGNRVESLAFKAWFAIRKNIHTYALEVISSGFIELFAVDEERHIILREQDIADENGVAMHVGASHVEEPGDFIQLGNEDAVGVLLTKCLPNALYFAFGRLAGKLQRLNLDLVLGDRRAVSPELFGRVEIRSELDASLSQRCFQLLDFSRGKNFAIDSDDIVLG